MAGDWIISFRKNKLACEESDICCCIAVKNKNFELILEVYTQELSLFLNKGRPMSLFLSYLLRLIPVWVTGTALSRGYETLQHLTGGVKTLLTCDRSRYCFITAVHRGLQARLSPLPSKCVFISAADHGPRDQSGRPEEPQIFVDCCYFLLPVCDRKRSTSAVTLHQTVREAIPSAIQNPALPTTLPACLPSR